jgi:hypothetical protein
MQIHPRDNDLILATHGRGLYILDDLTPLQNLAAAQTAEAELFDIRPSIRWNIWNRDGNLGQRRYAGENPPNGAMISYFLKSQPAGEVNIEVATASGAVVRRFRRVPDDAGVNRITWDLRYEAPAGGGLGGRGNRGAAAPTAAPDTSLQGLRERRRAAASERGGAGEEENFFGPSSAGVLPGTYQVTLVVNGKRYTKPVTVQNDPRIEMTPAQVAQQHDAAKAIEATQARVTRVVAGVDDLLRQLTGVQTTLRTARNDALAPAVTEIDGTIRDLRHFRDSVLARPLPGLGYRQYPRLREEVQTISGMIARPIWPITAGEQLRSGELVLETDDAQRRLDTIVRDRVGKINDLLKGTQHVITPNTPRVVQ